MKKLHAKRTSPYEVLRRIDDNVCKLSILRHLGINPVFNVQDLTLFYEPSTIQLTSLSRNLTSLPGEHSSTTRNDPFNTTSAILKGHEYYAGDQ